MGTCLVTKLKSDISDDTLERFGMFEFLATNTNRCFVGLGVGDHITSDKSFNVGSAGSASNVTEYTVQTAGTYSITPINANTNFCISKYNISTFNSYTLSGAYNALEVKDVSQLIYVKNSFVVKGIFHGTFNLSNIQHKDTITDIKFEWTGTFSDYKVILDSSSSFPALTGFTIQGMNSQAVNIENLIAPNLTSLNIPQLANVTGDLKTWAENMHSLGRNSGYCFVNAATGSGAAGVKWNGQSLYNASGSYNPYIVFSAGGVSISATRP